MPSKPILALAMGDLAGISAELTAKVLAEAEVRAAADILVVGDARVLEAGAKVAKVPLDVATWTPGAPAAFAGKPLLVDLGHADMTAIHAARSLPTSGAFALANFRSVLRLAHRGAVGAVTFTPFNKLAMKLANGVYEDELQIITEETQGQGQGREFNILGQLWNARVTSHVPLSAVAPLITKSSVLNAILLTARCMKEAGFANPRIAVAGLNPHAGDGGNFGREEIDEITPAIAAAKAEGIMCEGPFPSDTVFLRAKRGDFDAVQTMYHDQGQIAMKLLGFEAGVTLIGGYRFPICTPAHGTAYDIAGKGLAHPGATRNALLLAARMAKPVDLDAKAQGAMITAVVSEIRARAA